MQQKLLITTTTKKEQHNKLCENAENGICVCECGGRLHRIKTDHKIHEWFNQEEEEEEE